MSSKLTIALAGNPNSGKTTIFNRLTGARQHVGNYPGVTVEKKVGRCTHRGVQIEVVDLPGTYSLTAYSVEELIARSFIIDERPDVLVDIIDSANLERSLYLAVQFMELGVPLVLAFNMSDVARARGIEFDLERLSSLLGAPIVPTVGHKGRGTDELLDAVVALAEGGAGPSPVPVHYGREIEEEIARICASLEADGTLDAKYSRRWLAVKLLENDREARAAIASEEALAQVSRSAHHLEGVFGDAPETVIAGRRYGFISGACQEAVRSTVETRHTVSDKIDTVLLNHIVGIPIFLVLMYAVFHLVFTLGDYPMGWLEDLFAWSARGVAGLWPAGSDSMLKSLLVDGIIGGVGGVLAFLPNILLLFLAIAFLEDSGYMARAAFLMDRFMHRIGLHGKSFIPMLIGFGCSVPAIMATRTLESRRDRLVTMLIVPLMSCGARLTIYALIIPAFFAERWRAPVLWLIYLIGIALAVVCAKVLCATVFRGEAQAFVMELPLYRLPTGRGLLIHMWDRAWMYVRKAGTIILALSIVLWALTSYPRKGRFDRDYAAEAGQARADLLDGVRGLNASLGLPGDSDTLAAVVADELEMTGGTRPATPDECQLAVSRFLAARQLPAAAPEARAVQRFSRMRGELVSLRQRLGDPRGGSSLAPGGAESLARAEAHKPAFDQLRQADPNAFAAAVTYLDRLYAPYAVRRKALAGERRAEELAYTVAGRTGHALAPALRLIGFDWRIGTALIGAFAAKEVFVAQMGIVFAVGGAEGDTQALRERLQSRYTPLQGFCIMLFCLISMPCVATVAVTWRESGSWRWAALQLAGLTVLAYVVTLVVYQVGRLFI